MYWFVYIVILCEITSVQSLRSTMNLLIYVPKFYGLYSFYITAILIPYHVLVFIKKRAGFVTIFRSMSVINSVVNRKRMFGNTLPDVR